MPSRDGAAPRYTPVRRVVARRLAPAGSRAGLDREAARWVRAFRTLGDPTRARVLLALAQGEHCVGDLARRLRTTSSVVSHQLRVLRDLGLVRCRRSGRLAFYALRAEALRRLFEDSLARIRSAPRGRGQAARGGR
jgi:ArsR family transcriptional regulator